MPSGSSAAARSHLRVVAINDIYEFRNLPSLATFIKDVKANKVPGLGDAEPDAVIATLAGDFVAPSSLAALDRGIGMVDVLSKAGIDYVCIGNHESDIPNDALVKRIATSKFIWLNSNLPGLIPDRTGKDADGDAEKDVATGNMPEHEVIEVGGVKVALAGMCGFTSGMEKNPGFTKRALDGLVPPLDAARAIHKKLVEEEKKANIVVPITHQDLAKDIEILEADGGKFPLVLAGHEHELIAAEGIPAVIVADLRSGEGKEKKDLPAGEARTAKNVMVKAGADAETAMIVDVVWDTTGDGFLPPASITYRRVDVPTYPPNEKIAAACKRHYAKVVALSKMTLAFYIPDEFLPLTSKGCRNGPTTLSTLLLSMIRDMMGAEIAILPGGSFKQKEYAADVAGGEKDTLTIPAHNRVTFSHSDLSAVMPYPSLLQPVPMTGADILAALRFSRNGMKPGEEHNPFLQVDDGVAFVPGTVLTEQVDIATVGGEPFDAARTYHVAILDLMLTGMDKNEVLIKWAEDHKKEFDESFDDRRQAKHLIIEFFGQFWWHCLPTFDGIDTNKDGSISVEELKQVYVDILCGQYHPEASKIEKDWEPEQAIAISGVVDSLFGYVDGNRDGKITREEYQRVVGKVKGPRARTMNKFLKLVKPSAVTE
ncbi:Metallo-dependent phosphatase-like protein [Hyaloraphidium curvatum]|nr:Metallo-dependent phosphatase-like protein [Hyaloraphidium curvatum]